MERWREDSPKKEREAWPIIYFSIYNWRNDCFSASLFFVRWKKPGKASSTKRTDEQRSDLKLKYGTGMFYAHNFEDDDDINLCTGITKKRGESYGKYMCHKIHPETWAGTGCYSDNTWSTTQTRQPCPCSPSATTSRRNHDTGWTSASVLRPAQHISEE